MIYSGDRSRSASSFPFQPLSGGLLPCAGAARVCRRSRARNGGRCFGTPRAGGGLRSAATGNRGREADHGCSRDRGRRRRVSGQRRRRPGVLLRRERPLQLCRRRPDRRRLSTPSRDWSISCCGGPARLSIQANPPPRPDRPRGWRRRGRSRSDRGRSRRPCRCPRPGGRRRRGSYRPGPV